MATVEQPTGVVNLRDEALRILDKGGAILGAARELSEILRAAKLPGAVIGGIAVVLHGHVRSTKDIDVLVDRPLEAVADLFALHGVAFDPLRREFHFHGIPVHLVPSDQAGASPADSIEIEGISTVPLAVLVGMKLRSGRANILRAQDLADVIGLMRHHHLTGDFARMLDKSVRPEFRKLARALKQERST